MTDRTENNRAFDTTKILVIAAMGLTFNYTFTLGSAGLVVAYDWPGPITKCSGIATKGFPWIMLITNIYHLILILFGISADLSLHKYLIKKQNNSNGSSLVPWNVSSNQESNWKTNVPINATLIGTIVTTLSFAIGIWIVNVFKDDDVIGGIYRYTKLSYRNPAVGDFYGTGIEIWAGFGPVGITGKKKHLGRV